MKTMSITLVIFLASITLTLGQTTSPYEVVRLNNGQPIITQQMFTDLGATGEGENINGPSLIRVPSWIAPANRADSSAQYYLYFAHHSDDYVRMAWAANIEGPYHLYQVGTGVAVGDRGVIDHGGNYIYLDNDISIENNHLASPDVHVDSANQQIIMYFHAGSSTFVDGVEVNKQLTYVSTSPYGLEFYDNIEPVFLGSSYFRVFEYDGEMYALDNGAKINKALDASDPWAPPVGFDFTNELWDIRSDNPFQDDILTFDGLSSSQLRVRHTGVRVVGDELQVFYTRRGELGERVQMSTIDMSADDWEDWDSSYPPIEIMTANPGWEGGQYELLNSETSSAPENVNQLRDPYVFEDTDGKLYMVYAGQGENALGIARLYETPTSNLTVGPIMDAHVRGGSNANTNYGTATEMEAKQYTDASYFRKVYMKFDLSSVDAVEHAVVRLYSNSTNSRPVTVYETTNDWDESTITWNNAPAIGNTITTTQVGSTNQYYEWNISEYAQSKVGDSISLVFYIPSVNSATMKFSSKEGSNDPELVMVTASASAPADPDGLSAYVVSEEAIQLSWTDNAYNEDGYKVERKVGAGSYTQIADLGTSITNYLDSGLSSSTTYTYRVIAYNNTGNSNYSNVVSATTLQSVSSHTFNPDEDAYIRGGSNDNTNYGSETSLVVKQGSNSSFFRKSLLKFDLSSESLSGVTEATLRLYATKAASIDLTAYELGDSWSESTVTWNNAPSDGSYIDDVSLASEDVYYEIDVTDYVVDQLDGDGVISIGLWDINASNETIEFNSKEASGNLPELVIVTSAGARMASANGPAQNASGHRISFYPNPLEQGLLTIDLPGSNGPVDITISDIQGKVIYQNRIAAHRTIQLDTSSFLTQGLYIISIKTDDSATQSKLIVR